MTQEIFLYLNKNGYSFVAKVGAHNKSKTNQSIELIFDMKKTHFF